MRVSVPLLLVVATACGADTDDTAPPPALQPQDSCTAASAPNEDCIPAGIDLCSDGFMANDRGCDPVLPADPCGPGLMALPGEETCREVAPCDAGTWGSIPVEASAVYVDIAYAGGGNDGSESAPFTSIQQAVTAASAGAIVAVAAGSYAEDIVIAGKAVRLWGKCPAEVEVVGTADAVYVQGGADGTEVHSIALTGSGFGLAVTGAQDVVADRVWIHDTGNRGVEAWQAGVATSLLIHRSLIERADQVGVFLYAIPASIEDSVIRETQPRAGSIGNGIRAEVDNTGTIAAELTLKRSVLARNTSKALYVGASTAHIDASVIVDTQPQPVDGAFGRGIEVTTWIHGMPASLTLVSSAVERNREVGVFVSGATAMIDRTVVRDTDYDASARGRGIVAQYGLEADEATDITIKSCLLERNREATVLATGVNLHIDGVVVRNTRVALGDTGIGIQLREIVNPFVPTHATIRWSHVHDSVRMGISVFGAIASIEQTVVERTFATGQGLFGDGIIGVGTIDNSQVTITDCLIDSNERVGVGCFGSHVVLASTALGCNSIPLTQEAFGASACNLEDLGGNRCDCDGEEAVCKATTSGLEPPPPLTD